MAEALGNWEAGYWLVEFVFDEQSYWLFHDFNGRGKEKSGFLWKF